VDRKRGCMVCISRRRGREAARRQVRQIMVAGDVGWSIVQVQMLTLTMYIDAISWGGDLFLEADQCLPEAPRWDGYRTGIWHVRYKHRNYRCL
jgi:hypothetical protein